MAWDGWLDGVFGICSRVCYLMECAADDVF